MSGWIGVDLDGTLAEYHGWVGPADIGDPIPVMVQRVQEWYYQGTEVRIFTARAFPLGFVNYPYSSNWDPGSDYHTKVAKQAVEAIMEWCEIHLGFGLSVTCIKDYKMFELWDDRAIQVERNTGRRMDEHPIGDTTP